jgi:hypothetical protein
MKRIQKGLLLVLVGAVCLTGCMVRSVHPWLREQNLVFEEDLLGGWVGTGENEGVAMTFVTTKGNTYQIQYADKDNHGVFVGQLGRFGRDYFIDFRPADKAPNADGYLVFPAHSVARLEIGRDTLTVHQLNYGAVKAAAKLDRLRGLRYAWDSDDELILVSTTEDLEQFITSLGRDSNLYAPPIRLVRRK